MPNNRYARIQLRRASKQDLVNINPMLREGEPIVEKDTGRMKIGDGIHRFNDLKYVGDESQAIQDISTKMDELTDNVNVSMNEFKNTTEASINELKTSTQESIENIEKSTQESIESIQNSTYNSFDSLKYYGDASLIPSDESLFEFDEETQSIISYDHHSGEEVIVVPYKINGIEVKYIGRPRPRNDNSFDTCFAHAEAKKIILPSSIEHIIYAGFHFCKNLEELITNSEDIKFGRDIFQNCPKLHYIKLPNNIIEFSDYTFVELSSLDNVELPKELEYIGKECFADCTSLENIAFSDKLTYVGPNAFMNTSIKEINLPLSMTEIGEKAFANMSKLEKIILSNSIEYIDPTAFEGSNNVTIYCDYDSYAEKYAKENGIKYKCDMSFLKDEVIFCENPTDKNIFKYEDYEYGKKITGLNGNVPDIETLLDSIEIIKDEENSCWYTSESYELNFIENSVYSVALNIHYSTVVFIIMRIVNEVKQKIIDEKICYTIKNDYCHIDFIDNNNEGKFTIYVYGDVPESSSWKFEKITINHIKNPLYLDIPDNINGDYVTSINNNAFYNIDNIITISLPNTILSINNNAFKNCSNLREITNISSNLKYIGDSAFCGCSSLISFEMPDTLNYLGSYAFDTCSSLVNLKISNNLKIINRGTFYSCKSLKNVDIPNSIEHIGPSAFYTCTNLEYIFIPDSVEYLSGAFCECRSLKNVRLSNNLKEISSLTFAYCQSLNYIYIPDGVESIGSWAFYNVGDENAIIRLPNTIKSIDDDNTPSFASFIGTIICSKGSYVDECSKDIHNNLYDTRIVYESDISNTNNILKYYDKIVSPSSDSLFIIEDNSIETYEGTESTVVIPYEIYDGYWATAKRIGYTKQTYGEEPVIMKPFASNEHIEKVIIPNTVYDIHNQAFENCINLKEVDIPNSITRIGEGAFLGCALEEIELSKNLEILESNAFNNCNFKTITIPGKVNRVSTILANNISLKEILLKEGISEIDDPAGIFGTNAENKINIHIPDSVTTITNIDNNYIIICNSGSYAETYAKENNIEYRLNIIDIESIISETEQKLTPLSGTTEPTELNEGQVYYIYEE